jgi:hypothetical protein
MDHSSVILLKVDTGGVGPIEFEGNAPRAIDVNRKTRWRKASQSMEVKPGKIHLFRRAGDIQSIEVDQNPLVEPRIDLRRAALRPQIGQRLAPERPDHDAM